MSMNIRKNDTVVVLSGKDKGKEGKVLVASPKTNKVIVEGINVATKHQKARKQGEESGIMKVEIPMHACKVQLVCPKCDKGVRTKVEFVDGKKVRVCSKCGAKI